MTDKEEHYIDPYQKSADDDESKVVEITSDDEGSFKSWENEPEKVDDEDLNQHNSEVNKNIPDLATPTEEESKESAADAPIINYEADLSLAEEYKAKGNDMFKAKEYIEALDFYKKAIWHCPDDKTEQKAIYFNNKGMALLLLDRKDDALEAFTQSVSYNENYLKPRFQKLKIYKEQEKYSEAKEEGKFIMERDPSFGGIIAEMQKLDKLEAEKLNKMKDEVLGNLKNLGNMVLGKFGMSLDNFKLNQNADGTYNVSMNQ